MKSNETKESIKKKTAEMEARIAEFDKFSFYMNKKIERGIAEYRKGLFSVNVKDEFGKAVEGAKIKVVLKKHEFKFGCSLFLLDEFDNDEKNKLYRNKFKKVFNYGIAPLYWDTLEPEPGKLRFEKNSPKIYRRPSLDLIKEYCEENEIRMKGHCLMYNSFNPNWMPQKRRELKIAVDKRAREIAERYGNDFVDLDVVNEMVMVYKNAYGELGMRNYPITDDKEHAKWCFETAKRYFPHSTLFWNEGTIASFGTGEAGYFGDKSVYWLMLKRHISEGIPIGGIGMQFHAYEEPEDWEHKELYNPLRVTDVFDMYSEFNLPIHISEISIPSWSNSHETEFLQAELVKRMYKLWFSQKNVDAVVWWNMVDGTAYNGGTNESADENRFHAGLLRNDLSEKPAYKALDDLINKTWHTHEELITDVNGNVYFEGYFGDYDIVVTYNDKKSDITLPFLKENTGYYNLTYGPMKHNIII